jgi:hypothetical protein
LKLAEKHLVLKFKPEVTHKEDKGNLVFEVVDEAYHK